MMVKAWDIPGLTAAERLVLLALADCADREGRNAFKSRTTIAHHVQLKVRTVQRALQSLKLKGHIAIQELPRQHRPTTYRLFPGRGDRLSPLNGRSGETQGETNGHAQGRHHEARSLDPLLDPVDPGVLSLFQKAAAEILSRENGLTDPQAVARLLEWCQRRSLADQCTSALAAQAVRDARARKALA